MGEEKVTKIKKTRKIVCAILLLVFIAIIVILFPLFWKLTSSEGRAEFSVTIENLGFFGAFLIVLMEICKIAVVFLPGEPIELLAGLCYGPVVGTIIIYIGVLITTILIHTVVQKYGIALVEDIVPKDKLDKVQEMLKDSNGKLKTTLFILYFLPVLPKDFLTYIGSLLPMTTKEFLFITLFARFPAILSSTIVGGNILDKNVKVIVITYVVTYLISFTIAYIYNKKFNKSKREERKARREEENDG